jgi:hypothetical protein
MFFQIEAVVVKNARRQDFVDGVITVNDIKYLLSMKGGAGVCLHFPNCEPSFGLELKFATVMLDVESFQVWGTTRSGRAFDKVIKGLRVQASQELLYSRFLREVYGDHSQTLFLSSNYKLFSKMAEANENEDLPVRTSDSYSQLDFGGDVYKTFVQHIDGVVEKAVIGCYGTFVSLTEPIISHQEIVRLVAMFKSKFAEAYWALAQLLNYTRHMKNTRSQHLLPFYDRMIFYHFLSMARVRCHRTFSWWALVNACILL